MAPTSLIDFTHDPARRSWLDTANAEGGDFPLQNLPFGVFRRAGSSEAFRGGVAIGDQIVCLAALRDSGVLDGAAARACAAAALPALNDFLALGPAAWRALRQALFTLLASDAAPAVQATLRRCLVPMAEAEHTVPARIGDYTDFYTSIDHALNIGRLRTPDAPLTPNFQWLPLAYHGRASTVGVSGQRFRRPVGQALPPGAKVPVLRACAALDHELEVGIFIGPGNAPGEPVPVDEADAHIFGLCLLNDWSARDIQFWEMAPLGPFNGKNFATTISPWIVTLDALAPFRCPWQRPAADPQPLAYLESASQRAQGAFDITLEAWLEPAGGTPQRLSRTSFRHQYWSIAQMLAQHTVGGCSLQPGDLLGSGTVSGPGPGEAGAMVELTKFGTEPLLLPGGLQRGFFEDGDSVLLRGHCTAPGRVRIGFGESRGTVLPARAL